MKEKRFLVLISAFVTGSVFQHSLPQLNSKSSLDSPLEEGRRPKEELHKIDIKEIFISLFFLAVKT